MRWRIAYTWAGVAPWRLPIAASLTTHQAFTLMRTSGVRTIAALPHGGLDPDAIDWRGAVGLWIGGEGPGLPAELVERCDTQVTIPMAPQVESLNAAVAGALLVYAARRQRSEAEPRS